MRGLLRRWGAMLATATVAGAVVGYVVASASDVSPWPIAIACAVAGALGGLGLAALFERSGRGLRGVQDAMAVTGSRTLGVLGRRAWHAAAAPAIVTADADSAAADDYRLLAGKLQGLGARSFVLLRVEGVAPGVGAQLAAAVAERGGRVTRIEPEHGTALLFAPGDRPTPLRTAEAPDAVMHVSGAARVVEDGLDVADIVLVDLPSLERPTAVAWAGAVDGALIAAQVGRTTHDALVDATERLRHAQVPVLGVILGAPPRGIRPHA